MSQELLTIPADVLQSEQQNGKAIERTSASLGTQQERRMWLGIRRGLLNMVQAIEERYDMPKTKAGTGK